ncbi:MAG: FIST N-terminal domain-containing protein [Cyanobium sp.]
MVAIPSLPWLPRRERPAWCRTAVARDPSLQGAVDGLLRQLSGAGPADLALVFASVSYASDLPRLLPLLQQRLQARHWIGCVGAGIVGTDNEGAARELEHEAALSITLLHLPGATLHSFHLDGSGLPDLDGPAEPWREAVGVDLEAMKGMLLLVDPGCSAIHDLIGGLDYAYPASAKIGGVAGQHSAPHGSLLFADQVCGGAVGCVIGGSWRLDPVVAQGCRPIGPVFEVEQAQRNVVLQLSRGQERSSPVQALQGILGGLSPAEREQVKDSLLLGVARSDFRLDPAGEAPPPAFLVRNLLGVDPRNGAVAVGDRMRIGQKVQFQLRDAASSREESRQLILHEQRQAGAAPLAGLLFACLGRGRGLYGVPDGDVNLCREHFAGLPIAGVFCNGEIGPVGGGTHLHGYTASWGFLVPEA